MARINAGGDFGQSVAAPVSSAQVPREALGNPNALYRAGAEIQNEGMQLERQQIHEQKVAREKADAAVAQYKLYGLRDRLGDAINEIDQGVMDGTIQKTDAERVWKERSQKLMQEGLQGVPESHAQAVQLDALGVSESLGSKVGQIVRKRDQHDTGAALSQTIEYTQRLAVTDPAKARAILDQSLDQLGPAAGWMPEKIQAERQRWVEGTASTRAYTAIAAAKGDNKALAVVEKGISENADLDPQRKATMLAQIENYRGANEARALRAAQHAEIVAQRVQRESSAAFNVLSGWAMAGKAADPTAAAPLIQKLTATDAAAYRAMAAEIPARTAAAMLPLNDQQAQLDALYARRNQRGTSEPLETEIKRREDVLAQAKKDYGDEPLRAAQERGVLDAPVRPLNTGSIDGVVAGLTERVYQARTVSTRVGKPVSPLLGEEAGKLSDMLNALPVGQRAQWVKTLSGALPPEQARALAAQVSPKDEALGFAFADAAKTTQQGRSVAEMYLRGSQAKKDGTSTKNSVKPDIKESEWSAYFAEKLNGSLPDPRATSEAIKRAVLLSHALAAENGGALDGDTRDKALRWALGSGELVPRGQTITKDGRQTPALIPLPAGMTKSDLDKRLENLKPADLAGQAPDGKVKAGGVDVPLDQFLRSVPSAPLMPVRPGVFAPLVNGRPVLNSQGQPITIKVN